MSSVDKGLQVNSGNSGSSGDGLTGDGVQQPIRKPRQKLASVMKKILRLLAFALVLLTLTACPNNRDDAPGQNPVEEQGSGIARPEPEVNQNENLN